MRFKVEFSSQAKRFLKNLDKSKSLRMLDKFEEIKTNPFRYFKHFEGDGYELRIGDIRALIDVDFQNKILFVRVLDYRGRIFK